MNDKFYQKMADLQQYNPPATLQPISRSGQNNRITVDDVHARFMTAAIFGLVACGVSVGLFAFANIHWLLALPVGLTVFCVFYYVEMKDAKQYQAPLGAYGFQQQPPAEPVATRHTITAEVKTPTGMQIAEFEADPGAIKVFAGMVTRGQPFSEKTALSAGISQTQFNAMRDQFIKLGWAEWRNPAWPKAGVRLLSLGAAWIETAALPSSTGQTR
jgi:hypothetical protein